MQCGKCGYGQPGDADFCPKCLHSIERKLLPGEVPKPKTLVERLARPVFYMALAGILTRVGQAAWEKWMNEEQSRVEALLLGQVLSQRKLAQDAALDVE